MDCPKRVPDYECATASRRSPLTTDTLPATDALPRKTVDERKQSLASAIQTQVADGHRVESQNDFQAVLVKGHRPNHTAHLIATLATLGTWGIAWLIFVLVGGEKRKMVTVDEFGNVLVQKL